MHETELKFQVPAAARDALAARLGELGGTAVPMRARYFDTAQRHLGRAGFALRLRCEGPQWVQTLKGRGGHLLQRLEHNALVEGAVDAPPALDLQRHAGVPAGDALMQLLAAAGLAAADLHLQYETDFRRLAVRLSQGATAVELALDEGAIRASGRAVPIAELEIELLEGAPAGLVAVARDWVEPYGLWLDVRSKAERGDRLARSARPAVHELPQGAGPQAVLEAALANGAALAAGEGERPHVAALAQSLEALAAWADGVDPGGTDPRMTLAATCQAALQDPGARLALGERLRGAEVQRSWLNLLLH